MPRIDVVEVSRPGVTTVVGGLTESTANTLYGSKSAVDRLSTREYDVRAWGTPTGTATDVTFINTAISDIYDLGGGVLVFPNVATGYGVARVGDVQYTGIMLKPGVSLHSHGATFHMRDNCHFVVAESAITTTCTITANVTRGDTTYTVNSATGLTVGSWVLVRLNTRPEDTPEPLWWGYARITGISGSDVTLDTPAGMDCNVTTTTVVTNKQILEFDELIENVSLTGTWNFVNAMGSGENAEAGITLRYCRNVQIDDVIGTNVGAGAVGTQFCENVDTRSISVPVCAAQGGASSKGRAFGCAESTGIHVGQILIGEVDSAAPIFVEHVSRGIRIDYLHHLNTESGRDVDNKAIIHSAFDSEVHIAYLRAGGYPESIMQGFDGLTIGKMEIDFSAFPANYGGQVDAIQDGIRANGVAYGPRRRVSKTMAITPSMSNITAITIPQGFLVGLWFTLASTTDTGTWYLVTTAGTFNLNTALAVANVPYKVPNTSQWGGSGYTGVDYRYDKTLYIYTGSGVVANNSLTMTYEIFPLASDTSQADRTFTGLPAGLIQAPRPANADTSGATLAQLETEVNELKAVLRTLGLVTP